MGAKIYTNRRKYMAVTQEFVMAELKKVDKKMRANDSLLQETQSTLDKTIQAGKILKQEIVALRTLGVEDLPKSSRASLAKQWSEVLGIPYDEPSIMGIIAKYEKQDVRDGVTSVSPVKKDKPAPSPAPAPARVVAAAQNAQSNDTPVVETAEPTVAPKRRGRPPLTPEQKAERARQRAKAVEAANAALKKDEVDQVGVIDEEEENNNNIDEDGDDYFNMDDFDEDGDD
jgi:hypothetical protein